MSLSIEPGTELEGRRMIERWLRTARADGFSSLAPLLRRYILHRSFPFLTEAERENIRLNRGLGSLRGRLWMLFLRVDSVSVDKYHSLVKKGPSESDQVIIADDVRRTFSSDANFHKIVDKNRITRCLHAIVHAAKEEGDESGLPMCYYQGENVIAGMLLSVMPEVDAFFSLSRFLKVFIPTYFSANNIGAVAGCALVREVLKTADPIVSEYLQTSGAVAMQYAFAALLSFSANAKPLDEVAQLWDVYMAYGFHLNIFVVVGRILATKDSFMNDKYPNPGLALQETALDASSAIETALALLQKCPPRLLNDCIHHLWDHDVAMKWAAKAKMEVPS
eukprot:TRINITY_DN12949_c0_g1_i1.p1 TRINITY_DN12949_c0_g1~~TRINITY_DN12949_c0_g1_i1.p1  ORF type:complete len:335 (-),score=93.33 TRINITY_DN12949_c0_g1_i1:254-1258(-)